MNNVNWEKILKILDLDVYEVKPLKNKDTGRGLKKYHLETNIGEVCLLIASTDTQKFYLKRQFDGACEFELNNFNSVLKIKEPLIFENKLISYYLIENFSKYKKPKISDIRESILEKIAFETKKITSEVVEQSINEFLSAWPKSITNHIKNLEEYRDYVAEIKKQEEMDFVLEHGDLTRNNVYMRNEEILMSDFEFYKKNQPDGFDFYDYSLSMGKLDCEIKNKEINKIKYNLIEKINNIMDSGPEYLKVQEATEFDKFEDWFTTSQNKSLFLGYDWCKSWWDKFGENSKSKLLVFGRVEEGIVVRVWPFSVQNKVIRPVGSGPDLYDYWNPEVMTINELNFFVDYLKKYRLSCCIPYILSENKFFIDLYKLSNRNGFKIKVNVSDFEPVVDLELYSPKKKIRDDIKRLKNRLRDHFDKDVVFEIISEPAEDELKLFINMHKKRWKGGVFEKLNNYETFFKAINQKNDVELVKLSVGNKPIAYQMIYRESEKIVSGVTAYDIGYYAYSPGKIIIYDMIHNYKDAGFKQFSFGRGVEDYKYFFADTQNILMNIEIDASRHALINFTDRVFGIIKKLIRRLP